MEDIKDVSQKSKTRNTKALRTLIIGKRQDVSPVEKLEAGGAPGESKRLADDPFSALLAHGDVLEPPFDLLTLTMLPEHNTEMNQCIEALEINIEGFGFRMAPRVDVAEEGIPAEVKKAVNRERVFLANFFNYANFEHSFTAMRRLRRRDMETTGNAYWEVIRSASGRVQGFEYIPAYQIRLGKLDRDFISVDMPILRLNEDDSVDVDNIPTRRRFRNYVQTRIVYNPSGDRATDYKMVYFKDFGDPRVIDNTTGEVVKPEKLDNWDGKGTPMPEALKANELVHWRVMSARSPYGIPRYIGNLLSIFGDRKSEEINFTTFENNCVPSMMIMVSNGQLTQGSIARIQEYIDTQIMGQDNRSRFLIIEAESSEQDLPGEDSGISKMNVEKLKDQQQDDALFQEYSKNNQDKIRRVWRLPPILVGVSENYNRATAETARKLADEQVFAPERTEFDAWINRCLFPAMGIVFHEFKSNTPNTTDNLDLVQILAGSEKTGGITPRIARDIIADVLGKALPDFNNEFDPDVPFSLTMAEAVKNQADATEPGQQVTALKRWTADVRKIIDDNETVIPGLTEAIAARRNEE